MNARCSASKSPHPRSLSGLAEVVGPECAGTSPKSGAPVPPAMHVAVLAAPGARPCGPWLTIHSSILVTKVLCMRSRLQGLGKPVKKRYPRRSRRWRWGGVWGSAPVGLRWTPSVGPRNREFKLGFPGSLRSLLLSSVPFFSIQLEKRK